MELFANPTRIIFFTGKGGVGKTTLACATAVALADRGRRVLLVSTDPASNLDEVLGVTLGHQPTLVPHVPNLFGMNLDPLVAAAAYRERVVGPYRGQLPDDVIRGMEEQFSGACTVEIAAFDEFSRLLSDPAATADFDHVVFDTAPTGHTLRLLTLPSAWSAFLTTNTTGASCLGPLAGLQSRQTCYQQTVHSLSDGALTTIMLVARPETTAIREADQTRAELLKLGISNQHLIVNGNLTTHWRDDPVAVAMESRMMQSLGSMPQALSVLPRTMVALSGHGLLGIAALRAIPHGAAERTASDIASQPRPPLSVMRTIAHCDSGSDPKRLASDVVTQPEIEVPIGLGDLVDEMAAGGRGVILTMGKGGVGKTTVAAAVAVGLARRGHCVHLSTTDPAGHVIDAIASNPLPNLRVSHIDPREEIQKYTTEVLNAASNALDAAGRALLAEDLRSPCTEEIAVFRAFAKAVAEGQDQFVVLDTAPTGHTILLLDAALAYHREVMRRTSERPECITQLLPRLRDPRVTRVLIVTLPEATPVHEAEQLQNDLRRAGIEPFAWIINQSLAPLRVRDPILQSRQAHERKLIAKVVYRLATRSRLIPWLSEPPVGVPRIARLLNGAKGGVGSALIRNWPT